MSEGINVSIIVPEGLLEVVDREARRELRSRSNYIARVLAEALGWKGDFKRPGRPSGPVYGGEE